MAIYVFFQKLTSESIKLLFLLCMFCVQISLLGNSENPIKQENLILENIVKEFSNGNFQEAKNIWEENHLKYPSSILFDYWGGKILLYYPESNFSRKRKNFHKAVRHLVKSN